LALKEKENTNWYLQVINNFYSFRFNFWGDDFIYHVKDFYENETFEIVVAPKLQYHSSFLLKILRYFFVCCFFDFSCFDSFFINRNLLVFRGSEYFLTDRFRNFNDIFWFDGHKRLSVSESWDIVNYNLQEFYVFTFSYDIFFRNLFFLFSTDFFLYFSDNYETVGIFNNLNIYADKYLKSLFFFIIREIRDFLTITTYFFRLLQIWHKHYLMFFISLKCSVYKNIFFTPDFNFQDLYQLQASKLNTSFVLLFNNPDVFANPIPATLDLEYDLMFEEEENRIFKQVIEFRKEWINKKKQERKAVRKAVEDYFSIHFSQLLISPKVRKKRKKKLLETEEEKIEKEELMGEIMHTLTFTDHRFGGRRENFKMFYGLSKYTPLVNFFSYHTLLRYSQQSPLLFVRQDISKHLIFSNNQELNYDHLEEIYVDFHLLLIYLRELPNTISFLFFNIFMDENYLVFYDLSYQYTEDFTDFLRNITCFVHKTPDVLVEFLTARGWKETHNITLFKFILRFYFIKFDEWLNGSFFWSESICWWTFTEDCCLVFFNWMYYIYFLLLVKCIDLVENFFLEFFEHIFFALTTKNIIFPYLYPDQVYTSNFIIPNTDEELFLINTHYSITF